MKPIGILLLLTAVSGFCPAARATTWHVPSQCSTIQAGIDSASADDTVLVAPGKYAGDGNRDVRFGGKNLAVISAGGPEVTVIDCGGSLQETHRGFRFDGGETSFSVVEGFAIEGGYGNNGGAIHCTRSSPTVRNCFFIGNMAYGVGGAVFCEESSPVLAGCLFSENSSACSGGAIHARRSSPDVCNCEIIGNHAPSGGGVFSYHSNCTLTNCTFSDNLAEDYGGGAGCIGSVLSLADCDFSHNSAKWGGGVNCHNECSALITNCRFWFNSADWGGGLFFVVYFSAAVVSCTFVGNSALHGSGVFCNWASLTLDNTILTRGLQGNAYDTYDPSDIPTLTCCNIYGNEGGDWVDCIADQYGMDGNFSECPLFCDPENGDFHLQVCSPCAPGNHPDGYDCGLIGAFDVGCECGLPSSVERTTWSSLKALYR